MAGTLKKHLPRLHDGIVHANAKHLCHASSLEQDLRFARVVPEATRRRG